MKQLVLLASLLLIFGLYNNLIASNVDVSLTVLGSPHCNDGVDNDSDTFTDYPDDAGCDSLVDENEVNPSPPSPSPSPSPAPSTGGGGGGASNAVSANTVIFRGIAYPGSKVTILKDGKFAASVNADSDARFEATLSNLSAGNYVFGALAEDKNGERSAVYAFAVAITNGITTTVSDIFIPSTPKVSASSVKGNLNNDNKIDLMDFSIMAYWFKRSNPPLEVDLNDDRAINLIDFSIMAFYWTG